MLTKSWIPAVLFALLTFSMQAHSAVDTFIVFEKGGTAPDIATETNDADIATSAGINGGYCAVSGVTFGAGNVTTIGSQSGGAGGGKATFKDIVVEMNAGQAVNSLFLACATGKSYSKVSLVFRKAGASTKSIKPYFVVSLNLVLISSVEFVSSDEGVKARITLASGAIQMSLWKTRADGTLMTPPDVVTWNQVNNTANLNTVGQ